MAKKDVLDYRNQLNIDLIEMRDTLNDMEEIAMTSMISPEQLDQTRNLVNEMKQNLGRVDWILYLLEKPSKFEEFLIKVGLKKDLKKSLNLSASPEAVHAENKKLIEKVKSIFKSK